MLYEDLDIENPSPEFLRFNPRLIMEEIGDFSVVIMQAYDRYAELRSAEDEAKEAVKIVDAELADMLRKSASESGVRITESQISMDVLLDNRHIEAENKYLAARLASAKYNAFLEGLASKKSMMDLFGELVKRGYPMPNIGLADTDSREASWTAELDK
jgi:hypothetical protein